MDTINSHNMAKEVGSFADHLAWLAAFTKNFDRGLDFFYNTPFTICVDGPDKTGKTTLLEFFESACEEYGIRTMLMKMPMQHATRELLINDKGFSQFERTLIYFNDLVYARLLANSSDDIDLILMDRNPIFSTYAYTYSLLADIEQAYIADLIQANMGSFLVPDKTYLALHPAYETDDTYAAKVNNSSDIWNGYFAMADLRKLGRNMGFLYESPESLWTDIATPIALSELDIVGGMPVLYILNRILDDIRLDNE